MTPDALVDSQRTPIMQLEDRFRTTTEYICPCRTFTWFVAEACIFLQLISAVSYGYSYTRIFICGLNEPCLVKCRDWDNRKSVH